MRWLDLPPIWLCLFLAVAWWQAALWSYGLTFGPVWADLLGGLLVGAGVILMALAVFEMRRARTTVIPHLEPSQIVTTGIFSRTRNPIYLGDALVLTGLILAWDSVLSLPLVPIFVWLIERRFIIGEEARLNARFPDAFAQYAGKTRRWL